MKNREQIKLSADCFSIDGSGRVLVDKRAIDSVLSELVRTLQSGGENDNPSIQKLRCWAI